MDRTDLMTEQLDDNNDDSQNSQQFDVERVLSRDTRPLVMSRRRLFSDAAIISPMLQIHSAITSAVLC